MSILDQPSPCDICDKDLGPAGVGALYIIQRYARATLHICSEACYATYDRSPIHYSRRKDAKEMSHIAAYLTAAKHGPECVEEDGFCACGLSDARYEHANVEYRAERTLRGASFRYRGDTLAGLAHEIAGDRWTSVEYFGLWVERRMSEGEKLALKTALVPAIEQATVQRVRELKTERRQLLDALDRLPDELSPQARQSRLYAIAELDAKIAALEPEGIKP